MDRLMEFLDKVDSFVWGPPLLVLLVGTGIFLTLFMKCLQVRKLPLACKYIFQKEEGQGDVSSFGALCTALAATIGTGNIVGVATAVSVGGPGAVVWMWLAAFFGMATKYAEGLLAVKYREVDSNGQMVGGPMYYIKNGLGKKWGWLASLFCIFAILSAYFGIGSFPQINAISDSLSITFSVPPMVTGVVLAVIVGAVTLGGIKSISKVSEIVVPFMAVFYVVGCLIIIFRDIGALPGTLRYIISSAFSTSAAVGGFAGATVMMAMRNGVARGVFSNESGLGSAPIAAAAAKTNSCVRQGLISMTGTFFDTIVICFLTGVVIVQTGAWNSGLEGAAITNSAFATGIPGVGQYIVTIGLVFFALTTILGWNYYGERCAIYLFGTKSVMPYRLIFVCIILAAGFMNANNIEINMIWTLADIMNALMAIPNLIGILGLSGVIFAETKLYFDGLKR